jgi:hypothetical protein
MRLTSASKHYPTLDDQKHNHPRGQQRGPLDVILLSMAMASSSSGSISMYFILWLDQGRREEAARRNRPIMKGGRPRPFLHGSVSHTISEAMTMLALNRRCRLVDHHLAEIKESLAMMEIAERMEARTRADRRRGLEISQRKLGAARLRPPSRRFFPVWLSAEDLRRLLMVAYLSWAQRRLVKA